MPTNTRKIIRAFLASPGDLQAEREAIRDVVDEFNESWANALGYQVELMGWEDTIAGFGRPQHLINQDLDRCDLFIGMMWKKWGTPPDREGKFSSGFEEEFQRSLTRREEAGSPEISLFFKEVPGEFMEDPGDDLKKVLAFQKNIIADKKILFQNFSATRDVETLVRKCVSAHVSRAKEEDESSEPDELPAKRIQTGIEEAGAPGRAYESSPLSAEGSGFLEDFVGRIKLPDSKDSLSASDIARFRLLANSVSKPGNDKLSLGVHDINILFAAYCEGMELGEIEKRSLASLGFQHLTHENAPLWSWYSALVDSLFDPAILSSIVGANEEERVGAISVLTSLALDLPTDDGSIKRDTLINSWFSDDSSTRVRVAALGYLAKCGTALDLEVAKKEYDRSDYGTSRSALECMVGILVRTGQVTEAQELILESQFESLNLDLLKSLLEGFEGLESTKLVHGLEHRNSQVRLHSMKSLHGQGALDVKLAERLCGDSDALVRNEAIKALLDLGKSLAEEDIRKILIPPKKQPSTGHLGLGIAAAEDKMGEELFLQYQSRTLKSLSEVDLRQKVATDLVFDDAAYFSLVERYFRNNSAELRRNVDDKFAAYFEERICRMKATFGDSSSAQDLIKKTKGLEEILRKKFTRKGLNVLCAAQKSEDLHRIRANLRDGFAGASKFDAEYLAKHGEWADIPLLANAEGPKSGSTLLTISANEDFQIGVARAIIAIGKKHSVSDLLSIQMPAAVLKKTIDLCAESRFAKISRIALLSLLNHESDKVRKTAAILAVRALPIKQIKAVLHEYVDNDDYRYYNVIHWLDLGASMRREDARKVALAASS